MAAASHRVASGDANRFKIPEIAKARKENKTHDSELGGNAFRFLPVSLCSAKPACWHVLNYAWKLDHSWHCCGSLSDV